MSTPPTTRRRRRIPWRRLLMGLALLFILGGVAAAVLIRQRFVQGQFAGLETDALTLVAQPDYESMTGVPAEQARLTAADIEAIRSLPNVREVSPRLWGGGEVRAGATFAFGSITGVEPVYLRPTMRVALGRFISDQDIEARARVLVLDWPLAQQLFPDGRPLGREVVARGLSFSVIGVLALQQNGFFAGGGSALLPISVARDRLNPQAALGPVQVSEAVIYLEDPMRIAETQQAITQLLRARHKLIPEQGNDFSFQNLSQFVEANNNILLGITVFLGVIGSIALLVGGIGIMNIMLVSVAERTREIGLRKAVGARRRDILAQFLFESVTLSLIGGISGVLLTIFLVNAGAIIIHRFFSQIGIGQHLSIDAQAMALALAFASLIGLVAGIYPAIRASRLPPIEALRTM